MKVKNMYKYLVACVAVFMMCASLSFAQSSRAVEGQARQLQGLKTMMEAYRTHVADRMQQLEQDIDELVDFANGANRCAANGEIFNGQECLSPGSSLDLANAFHSTTQCEYLGGEVVEDDQGMSFCRFDRTSCPGGWHQHENWTQTAGNYCRGSGCNARRCRVGGHAWSNAPVESCRYQSGREDSDDRCRVTSSTCNSVIEQIGCF